jgi:hypothetical protein
MEKIELMERFEESFEDAHGFPCPDHSYDKFFEAWLADKEDDTPYEQEYREPAPTALQNFLDNKLEK